jgi:small-conductance mechanosensitive channel
MHLTTKTYAWRHLLVVALLASPSAFSDEPLIIKKKAAASAEQPKTERDPHKVAKEENAKEKRLPVDEATHNAATPPVTRGEPDPVPPIKRATNLEQVAPANADAPKKSNVTSQNVKEPKREKQSRKTKRRAPRAAPKRLLDAGRAHSTDSGPPVLSKVAFVEPVFVEYKDLKSPLSYQATVRGKTPQQRAQYASAKLESAMDRGTDKINVILKLKDGGNAFDILLDQNHVATFYKDDATAAGLTVRELRARTETQLGSFVRSQMRRRVLQSFALNLLLSILIAVASFMVIRFFRFLFERWDRLLYDARESLAPLTVLRVPVVSGETWGGTLAFGLVIGRFVSYISTVGLGVGLILSLFDNTRAYPAALGQWSLYLILDAAETVVGAVPGLVLAGLLIIAGRGGLRVIHVLLNGVANRQLSWPLLSPDRVPVVRTLASTLVVILLGPLAIAAAFGQFGSPLESIFLMIAGVMCLSMVPILACYAVGFLTLWNRSITLGDWVQLHDISGEVIDVSLRAIRIVPEKGGVIVIPMLLLLFRPLHRIKEPPAVSFDINVSRDRPVQEILKIVEAAVHASEPDARVECTQIYQDWVEFCVAAPSVRAGIRQTLLMTVCDALAEKNITLSPRPQ